MATHEVNADLDVLGTVRIENVNNQTGNILLWNPSGKTISTRTNAQFILDYGLAMASDIRFHEHANKTVLDSISQANINDWNSKEPGFLKNTAFNKDFGTTYDTVARGDAPQLAVDNLEIGGRNILRNSRKLNYYANDVGLGTPVQMTDEDIPYTRVTANFYVSTYGDDGSSSSNVFTVPPIEGQKYTVSCEVRVPVAGLVLLKGMYTSVTEINKWKTIKSSYTYSEGVRAIGIQYDGSNTIDVRNWKIEKGNKATDWTPAPEDQISDFNQNDTTAFDYIKNRPNIALIESTLANKANTNADNINSEAFRDKLKIGNRATWASIDVRNTIVGGLAWPAYGNEHTIHDFSSGTAPNGVAKNNVNSEVPWSTNYPTLMGWNGSSTYGVRVDSSRVSDKTLKIWNGEADMEMKWDYGGDVSPQWLWGSNEGSSTARVYSPGSLDVKSSGLLRARNNYSLDASTLPDGLAKGITNVFVGSAENGFPSYGSVMSMSSYSAGGGGALQMYTPYGTALGGDNLQVRFGKYDDGQWTSWKTLMNQGDTASNSDKWNGLSFNGSFLNTASGVLVYDGGSGSYLMSLSGFKGWLGLGSNAYNSTSYLPLAGGAIDGNLAVYGNTDLYGTIYSKAIIPFINKATGFKSFGMHHAASNAFIFMPSTSVDGTDWDWSKQMLYSLDNGSLSANMFIGQLQGNVTGNADTATLAANATNATLAETAKQLQTPRLINRVAFDGTQNIEVTEWYHSGRDFTHGTLIKTSIWYGSSSGDPFILEIKGNSYGAGLPFDIQIQGYIYSDTIISLSGLSNGNPIAGIIAMNVDNYLCFWFPRQNYWQGFNVKAYAAFNAINNNKVVSITDEIQPVGATKLVDISASIKQSWHSGNFNPNNYETSSQLNARDTNNRNRAYHTGTQLASTISDLQSAISSNSAVTANTAKVGITPTQAANIVTNNAKVTNANHTGEVTGDEYLTITPNAVTLDKIQQLEKYRLLGNPTDSDSNVQDIMLGTNLGFDIDGRLESYVGAHTHPFSQITDTPTTFGGYGITDAVSFGTVTAHVSEATATKAYINNFNIAPESGTKAKLLYASTATPTNGFGTNKYGVSIFLPQYQSTTNGSQLGFDIDGNLSTKALIGGTWQPWKKILTETEVNSLITSSSAITKELVTNFNAPTGFKLLQGTSSATNAPISSFAQGIQFSADNNSSYINQLVFDLDGKLYARSKVNGTWETSWNEVKTSKNSFRTVGSWTSLTSTLPTQFTTSTVRYQVMRGKWVLDMDLYCNGVGGSTSTNQVICTSIPNVDAEMLRSINLESYIETNSGCLSDIRIVSDGTTVRLRATINSQFSGNFKLRAALPISNLD